MKPIMITLSKELYFNDFLQGSFKATSIEKEGTALVFTTTLVGKATKAPDYKKNQLIKNFMVNVGEWTQLNLNTLNGKNIKSIRIKPIVPDLLKRIRRNAGLARFYINGADTSFSISVGNDYITLAVPDYAAPSADSKKHIANLRKMFDKEPV